MKPRNVVALLAVTGLMCCFATSLQAQVREIPRRFLPDIARVYQTRSGPVIYYNPAVCRRVGPEVCAFFRAHEYAHIRLNHFSRPISRRQAEAEADAYAARMVSPSTAAAAQRFFLRGHGGSYHHGRPIQRARRVSYSASRPVYYFRR